MCHLMRLTKPHEEGYYSYLYFLIFQAEDVGLKLRSFNKEATDHLQRRTENEPTYQQLGHTEDMRLNHTNYHVTNPANKDW